MLSACETGLYDTKRNPEEFVGLPATFMQLGAAGVLGTLWQVDDLATALLMAKFYEMHLGESLEPPTALGRAQAWLRQATKAELIAYVRTAATRAKVGTTALAELETMLTTGGPGNQHAFRRHLGWTAEEGHRNKLSSRERRPETTPKV